MQSYWFGNSSRTGAILVASIDLAYAFVDLLSGLFVIFLPDLFINSPSTQNSFIFPPHYLPNTNSIEESVILAVGATISVFIAEVALVGILICSIIQRNPWKADLWVKIRLTLLAIGTFAYVFEMTLATFLNIWTIISLILILFIAVGYRIYSILLVRSFHRDLLFVLNGYDLGLKLYPNKI